VTQRYRGEGMHGGHFDFLAHPSTEHLPHLLSWAVANQLPSQQEYLPWPSGTPMPELPEMIPGAPMNDRAIAGEIALVAAAWIMHHELAHIAKDHRSGSPTSMEDERAADDAALEWLLGRAPADSLFRRGLGIAAATVGFAGLELATYGSRYGPRTHPHPADRLFRALSHARLMPDDRIHLVASLQLVIHLDERGVKITDPGNQSAHDCLGSVCAAMKRCFP
jgi:hypothetical protein